jgi:hypothetical protein
MNTQGRFEMDTPFVDGMFPVTIDDINNYGGVGVPIKQRNAKGDYSFNQPINTTAVYATSFAGLIFRTGQAPFLQEQFGTAAGVAGPTAVANTSSPDGTSGVPPFTGASQLVVQTGNIPKGIKILDITLKYVITGAALGLHTVGLSKSVFANNAAIVVTDILANAANGLATAVQAQPYVTKISIVSPVFQVSDLADIWLEIDATTGGVATYKLYGASVHVSFNYN